MSTPEDKMSDWGMEFINQVDHKVQQPGNEAILAHWAEGDFTECFDWLKQTYPEVTEDQWEWVEEFLSEI